MITKLFYLLIALFPLGVLSRLEVLPSVIISIQDVCVFLILLFSIKQIGAFFVKKSTVFVPLLFLFFLVGILGLFVESKNLFEFVVSVSYLVRLYGYILLVIPLLLLKKQVISNLKKEMIVSGFVFVLLGYIQFVFYPDLRNLSYLGWDEHLYRLFSTFLDPNFAGAFIVLLILFYSYFVFSQTKKVNTKVKLIFLTGYAVLLPSLFLTYSRGAFIMLAVSALSFLFLTKKAKLGLLLLAVFVFGIFLLPKDSGGEGVKLLRTSSIISRVKVNATAVKIFQDHPIIGVGFNSLRFSSLEYNFLGSPDLYKSHSAAGIPNSYLFVLATTGILGISLFFAFIFKLAQDIVSEIIKKKNIVLSSCVAASFVGLLVDSLFENTLFYTPILVWMVLLLGIFYSEKSKA